MIGRPRLLRIAGRQQIRLPLRLHEQKRRLRWIKAEIEAAIAARDVTPVHHMLHRGTVRARQMLRQVVQKRDLGDFRARNTSFLAAISADQFRLRGGQRHGPRVERRHPRPDGEHAKQAERRKAQEGAPRRPGEIDRRVDACAGIDDQVPVIRVIIKLAENPAVILIDERAGRRARGQLRLKCAEAEFVVEQVCDVEQHQCPERTEGKRGIRRSQRENQIQRSHHPRAHKPEAPPAVQPHLTEHLGQFRVFIDTLALFAVAEPITDPKQDHAGRIRQQHDPVLQAPEQRKEADHERQRKQPRREPAIRRNGRKVDGFRARRSLPAPAMLHLQALEREITPRIGHIRQDADEQEPDRPERHIQAKRPHKHARNCRQHQSDANRPFLPPETGKTHSNVRISLKCRWDRHADGQILLKLCVVDQDARHQRRNPQHAQP